MSNEELLGRIIELEVIIGSTAAATNRIEVQLQEHNSRLIQYSDEFDTLRSRIDNAITTAVHELIEWLRYNDIQALDEQEFSEKIYELIFNTDKDSYYLPF